MCIRDRPSPFKRAIKKFMNFSDFDTLYISPNRYNYALMATHFRKSSDLMYLVIVSGTAVEYIYAKFGTI